MVHYRASFTQNFRFLSTKMRAVRHYEAKFVKIMPPELIAQESLVKENTFKT